MCGLVGAFGRHGANFGDESLRPALARMARRGPDGEGTWREVTTVDAKRALPVPKSLSVKAES